MSGVSRWLIPLIAAIWVILVAWGFAAYATLEPSGSGFTRGSNRISAFLGWQFAALLAAGVADAFRPAGKDAGLTYWLSRREVRNHFLPLHQRMTNQAGRTGRR